MVRAGQRITHIRKLRKATLLKGCGGKCVICGYNKISRALTFHHVDETKKEFTLSGGYLYSWETIIKEVKKCILVCSNCHEEIHGGLYFKGNIDIYYNEMVFNDTIFKEGNRKRQKKNYEQQNVLFVKQLIKEKA